MKLQTTLILATLFIACGKKKDSCQLLQGNCNGYAYDCEADTCACEFPYEGERCEVYPFESFEGIYIGTERQYWGKSGAVNWDATVEFVIDGEGKDSIYDRAVKWRSKNSFELFDQGGDLVGSGSVIDDELKLTYSYNDFKDGDVEYVTVFFTGREI